MRRDWIRLYRKLRKNPIWKKKPFTKGQAWVDLLLRANYIESKLMVGNQIIKILPGQIFTSEKHLAEDWGWSRQKVRHFEGTLLANDQICTPKKTSKYTILTITNWVRDQNPDNEKDTKKDIKRTSNEHQKDTSKNYKNLKNDKEVNTITTESQSPEVNLNHIMALYQTKFPQQRKIYGMGGLIRARDYFEGILKSGYSIDDVKQAIDKASDSAPWNIIKPKKGESPLKRAIRKRKGKKK